MWQAGMWQAGMCLLAMFCSGVSDLPTCRGQHLHPKGGLLRRSYSPDFCAEKQAYQVYCNFHHTRFTWCFTAPSFGMPLQTTAIFTRFYAQKSRDGPGRQRQDNQHADCARQAVKHAHFWTSIHGCNRRVIFLRVL